MHAAGYDLREPSTGELMLSKGPQRPQDAIDKDPHTRVLCTSPNRGPAVVDVGSFCSVKCVSGHSAPIADAAGYKGKRHLTYKRV